MTSHSNICFNVILTSINNKIVPCYNIKLINNEKGIKKELPESSFYRKIKAFVAKKWSRFLCRAKQSFQASLHQTPKCWKHMHFLNLPICTHRQKGDGGDTAMKCMSRYMVQTIYYIRVTIPIQTFIKYTRAELDS